MGSKSPTTLIKKINGTANASINRSSKGKVPKRIHKAEREKLKREHLNELYLELATALELTQNNGKASILCEATRLLKGLFGQIESLEKENASLLSESHYVTMEKNELKQENSALETQISKLQTEIEVRKNQSKPPPPDNHQQQQRELASHFQEEVGGLRQPPLAPTAVLVLPLQPDPQSTFHASDTKMKMPLKLSSNVTRPHPRYPSAADSWTSKLLKERLRVGGEVQVTGSCSDSSGAAL